MPNILRHYRIAAFVLLMGAPWLTASAVAAPEYHPVSSTMEGKTITLTGRDMTIDQALAWLGDR